ncbi:PGAP1-like protein-domain-containing protein [Syncephalis plumigaleata]|nr:PGAP1-like protein-domain-containing protein [Syncephalis plumigaleata]
MASSYASMPLDGINEHNNSEDVCNVDATGNTISTTIDDSHDLPIYEEEVPLMRVAVDQIGSPELVADTRRQQRYSNRASSTFDNAAQCDTSKANSPRKSCKATSSLEHTEGEDDVEDRLADRQPLMVANGGGIDLGRTSGEQISADITTISAAASASSSYPRGRHRSPGNNASHAMSRSPSTEAMDNSSFSDSDVDSITAKDLLHCKHPSADLAKVVTRHVTMTRLLGGITLLTCLFALLSAHAYFNNQLDRKTCDMTYLRPIFKRLDQFDSEYTVWRDGYDSADELNGIPVLFVHGNAGSYKQVKSIGSEAAIHYHKELGGDSTTAHAGVLGLDMFTVDFNEEFTAFHGQSMLEQAEYINDAIQYILSLYSDRRPATQFQSHRSSLLYPAPTSVILLGHSMGGMVSRVAFTLPNFQRGSVNTLITISSPHIAPPAPLDRKINSIYSNVNAYWRRSFERPGAANPLRDVILIAISGGRPDNMINSDLCDVASIVPRTHGFTVYSTSIPRVWSSMDHHCILWCVAPVRTIVQSIYSVVDARRESQTKPRAARLIALRHQLLSGLDESDLREATEAAIGTSLSIDKSSTSTPSSSSSSSSLSTYYPRLDDTHTISLSVEPHYLLSSDDLLVLPVVNDQAFNMELHNQSVVPYVTDHIQLFPLPRTSTDHTNNDAADEDIWFTALSDRSFGGTDDPMDIMVCRDARTVEHDDFVGKEPTASLPPDELKCASLASLARVLPGYAAQRGGGDNGWQQRIPLHQDDTRWDDNTEYDYDYDGIPPGETGRWTVLQLPVNTYSYIAIVPRANIRPPRVLRVEFSNKRDSMHKVEASWMGKILFEGIQVQILPPADRLASVFTKIHFPLINNPMLAYRVTIDASPHCERSAIDHTAFPTLIQQSTDRMYESNLGRWLKRMDMVVLAFPFAIIFGILYMQLKQWSNTNEYPSFMQSLSYFHAIVIDTQFVFDDYDTMMPATAATATASYSSDSLLMEASSAAASSLAVATGTVQNAAAFMDTSTWNGRALLTGDRGVFYATGILVLVAGCLFIILGLFVLPSVWIIDVATICQSILESNNDRPDESMGHRFRRRAITTGLLFLLVLVFVPSQFAFLVAFIVHLMACARTWLIGETETDAKLRKQAWYRFHYQFTLLVLFLACIPFTGPLLLAWVRNISVLWVDPNSSDHALWVVAPFTLLVEIASQSLPPRMEKRSIQTISLLLFSINIMICLLFGVRDTYMIYDAASWTATWLVILHVIRSRAGKKLLAYIQRYLTIDGKKQH